MALMSVLACHVCQHIDAASSILMWMLSSSQLQMTAHKQCVHFQVTPCCDCCAMLCYAVLRRAMLCGAVLCWAMLPSAVMH